MLCRLLLCPNAGLWLCPTCLKQLSAHGALVAVSANDHPCRDAMGAAVGAVLQGELHCALRIFMDGLCSPRVPMSNSSMLQPRGKHTNAQAALPLLHDGTASPIAQMQHAFAPSAVCRAARSLASGSVPGPLVACSSAHLWTLTSQRRHCGQWAEGFRCQEGRPPVPASCRHRTYWHSAVKQGQGLCYGGRFALQCDPAVAL